MPAFRKRPIVIEAVQYTGDNTAEIAVFTEGRAMVGEDFVVIPTLEGRMTAIPGCWILKGTAGELYPCQADVFAQTYEPIGGTQQ